MKLQKIFFVACLLIAAILFFFMTNVFSGEENKTLFLAKQAAFTENEYRRTGIHDGNLIRTAFSNFGNLSSRSIDIRGEWPKGSRINYLFECCFYLAAEVIDAYGQTVHIISESYTGGPRDKSDDESHTYSWEPLPGYFNELRTNIDNFPAMSHQFETWPLSWPNRSSDWDSKWNGEFGPYAISDQESYYVMDDRNNDEFAYYPFVGSHQDSLPWPDGRRGLGVEVEVRAFQWADPRLEDVWFTTYDIKNVSDKNLEKVVCGFYHDWDVGTEGPASDAGDDTLVVDPQSNMVIQWDVNGESAKGKPTGYITHKILDTPDNVGLTSFYGTTAGDVLSADAEAWQLKIKPGIFSGLLGGHDVAFITGSGYFSLLRGETKRYAIAIVMGKDREEIYQNARYAQWFYDGTFAFNVHQANLAYPLGGENVNGVIDIQWTASGIGDVLAVDIFCSTDDWKTWHTIAANSDNTGSYAWDTNEVADGINYSVLVVAYNNSGMGESQRSNYFTINNPVAAYPEVSIIKPAIEESISGTYATKWRAGDADGEAVFLDLFYSADSGKNWLTISEHEVNDSGFEWDTRPYPNGDRYLLKAVVTDGNLLGMDVMKKPFSIGNKRPYLEPAKVEHISGVGDGEVNVNILDLAALTGHTYELTFNPLDTPKTYDVFDVVMSSFALQNAQINNYFEGPEFDGVRLWIKDFAQAIPNEELTRWTSGNCNLMPFVEKDATIGRNAIALPADFEIRIFGANADTSYSAISSFRVPVNFQVWNVTDSVKMEFVFTEFGVPDSAITIKDKITIITNRVGRRFNTAWAITFNEPLLEDAVLPDSGDVLFVSILKPFSEKDIFRFKIHEDYVVSVPREIQPPGSFFLKQNYPNPFNAGTTIEYSIANPTKTKIKIYDVLGREVITLVDGFQKQGVYRILWDGRDSMNQLVASGVYLFRIEAGNFFNTKKLIYLK